ncbi:MAG: hypothetical protein LBQ68_08825 [Clostridiales bacterium]|nr:hypothetical protein [Clostridiales bacterium]
MHKTKKKASKIVSVLAAAMLVVMAFSMTAFAAGYEDLEAGKTYVADAELSCFVAAMGGVEFGGGGIFDGKVTINVDAGGNKSITMNFATGGFVIYSVQAVTFLDANATASNSTREVPDGTIGIYDEDGVTIITEGVSYTESSNTAEAPNGSQVNYIDSITFPLPYDSNTYGLTFYLNSQVMGMQFGKAAGSTNTSAYAAMLTVDWSSVTKVAVADETNQQSAVVNYNVPEGYEVSIPATITVDSSSKTGSYEIKAGNFVVAEDAYVTVTAATSGSVTNGSKSIAFTNALESGKLEAAGDKLNGTVTITGSATAAGAYSGTLDFTISYFSE